MASSRPGSANHDRLSRMEVDDHPNYPNREETNMDISNIIQPPVQSKFLKQAKNVIKSSVDKLVSQKESEIQNNSVNSNHVAERTFNQPKPTMKVSKFNANGRDKSAKMTGNEMSKSKSYIDNRHHSTFSDFRNSNLGDFCSDRQSQSRMSRVADNELYSTDTDYSRTTESKYLKRKESDKDLGENFDNRTKQAQAKEEQKRIASSKSNTYTVSLQAPNSMPQDSEFQNKTSGNSPVERKKVGCFLDLV